MAEKEYIERGALLERMESRLRSLGKEYGDHDHYTDGFDEGLVAVEEAPAADVVEVRHGKWTRIEINGKHYGQIYYQHKECIVNETQLFPSPYDYCPNCGAKMDGGTK